MISESNTTVYTASGEKDEIDRNMLVWANTFPDMPESVVIIKYEFLLAGTTGMALSTITSSYVTKRYILGGYQAEYSFEVYYRIHKAGTSDDKRLQAVELLNKFGDWAETQFPDIGKNRRVLNVRITDRASKLGQYENGDEDFRIPLKLTYEVT